MCIASQCSNLERRKNKFSVFKEKKDAQCSEVPESCLPDPRVLTIALGLPYSC